MKMRGKILIYGYGAFVALFSFPPEPLQAHGDRVSVKDSYMPGTIVIRTGERRLYYFVGAGDAIRYPVGVGRAGMQWSGAAVINGKYIEPAWSARASIRRDYRSLPSVVPGGSSHNPMGAAAMTLSGGEYAIHGTNAPGTIGGFVSHGCIRMYNEDIMDLYSRVGVGTRVVVTR
jgi:lipoprotein-anchoring transpeptidase ErfK/SrfK